MVERRDISLTYSIEQLKRQYDFWKSNDKNENEKYEKRISALEEGKQDLLKSGQNIKTINSESILGSGDIKPISDTGWVDITPLHGTWTYLQYRVVNDNHVYIRGYATSFAASSSTGYMVSTDIPTEYRPTSNQYFYGHLAGSRMSRWFITSTGLGIDWAVTISSGDKYTTATWHYFSFDYFID